MKSGLQYVNNEKVKTVIKRVWVWNVILTVIICLWPVEYQIRRFLLAIGIAATWSGALVLWWQRKVIRSVLLLAGMLPALVMSMPGRAIDPDLLAADYSKGLRLFRGVRYVWGGEGWLGIDCSGLVRKGLMWGQLYHGLRTVNGRPVRAAIALWWHDSSAEALRDGYRGWTFELFRQDGIDGADLSRLRPGDLAVTADGVHVMAYLGKNAWIQADPDALKVIEVVPPTNNRWFHVPVVFLRWKWLDAGEFANSAAVRTSGLRLC